jgi:FMN-dependent NADH-azoreductase
MNLLHIDSSILGANSVSRNLSAKLVAELQKQTPDIATTYRDLAATPIPHLSGAYLAASQGAGVGDAALQADVAIGAKVLEEFLAADVVVIGVAFYNFTISSQLKAWIDRIAVSGKTFRYTEKGPEGLAGNKRVILAIARGGLYGPGMPSEAFEHAESYLRSVFAFIGVANPEIIVAEGLQISPEKREAALAQAEQQIHAAVSLRRAA